MVSTNLSQALAQLLCDPNQTHVMVQARVLSGFILNCLDTFWDTTMSYAIAVLKIHLATRFSTPFDARWGVSHQVFETVLSGPQPSRPYFVLYLYASLSEHSGRSMGWDTSGYNGVSSASMDGLQTPKARQF